MDDDAPRLVCYRAPGWDPRIVPADHRRDWMDRSQHQFAYRCLPMPMANAYGWHVLNRSDVSAVWDGSPGVGGVRVSPVPGRRNEGGMPVSIFGLGVLTWHVQGIVRTPPGWNLWVSGPANHAKDGISALSGLIEADWIVMEWTMNWRFTRPGAPVTFAAGEPIAQFFPVPRGAVEGMRPEMRPMSDDPDLEAQHAEWSRRRNAQHAKVRVSPPLTQDEAWEKDYFKGMDMRGRRFPGHQGKVRMRPFDRGGPEG